jgi:hypothetical protein
MRIIFIMKAHRFLLLFCLLLCLTFVNQLQAADEPPRDGKDTDRSQFLIVAPETFHKALARYVTYKQKQLPAKLVSLEQILSSTAGVDDPEKLKRYLFDSWKDKLTHVLLVGDADILPVRYMVLDRKVKEAFYYAFYPSDLYYSDLADAEGQFDDWNDSRDSFHAGYFGEVRGEYNKDDPINYDNVDYRPDIAVGRWPVSTVEQVELLISKSISYEQNLADRKPSAALVSVGGWVDSRPAMDRVATELTDRNWSLEKRYYSDRRRDDQTPPPTEEQLKQLLNSGTSMIFHAGHGTDDTWQHCFSVKSISGLDNENGLPIMISAGCSTARFASLPPYEPYLDVEGHEHKGTNSGEVFKSPPPPPAPYQTGRFNRTGLGEQLLKQGPCGAVAYIGCNTGSQPCGLTLLDGFAQSVATREKPLLGDCWADAIRYYYSKERLAHLKPTDGWYPPSIFFQGMKFMLFGDPTLKIAAQK